MKLLCRTSPLISTPGAGRYPLALKRYSDACDKVQLGEIGQANGDLRLMALEVR